MFARIGAPFVALITFLGAALDAVVREDPRDRILPLLAALGLLTMLAMVIWGGLAQAQEAVAAERVDMAPFVAQALVAVAMFLGVPAAWYLVRLAIAKLETMGFQIDQARRDYLEEVIRRGLVEATERLAGHIQERGLPVEIRSQIIAEGAKYVATHGADTLRKLKADPKNAEQVEQLVRARAALLLSSSGPNA